MDYLELSCENISLIAVFILVDAAIKAWHIVRKFSTKFQI